MGSGRESRRQGRGSLEELWGCSCVAYSLHGVGNILQIQGFCCHAFLPFTSAHDVHSIAVYRDWLRSCGLYGRYLYILWISFWLMVLLEQLCGHARHGDAMCTFGSWNGLYSPSHK